MAICSSVDMGQLVNVYSFLNVGPDYNVYNYLNKCIVTRCTLLKNHSPCSYEGTCMCTFLSLITFFIFPAASPFMYPIGSLLPIPLSFHLSCASLFPPTPLSLKYLSSHLASITSSSLWPHVPSSSSGMSTAASNILSQVQPESANVIGSTIYFLLPTLLTVYRHWSLSCTGASVMVQTWIYRHLHSPTHLMR